MSTSAIILFGHGARDPEWARPMERVRDAVRAGAPGVEVEVAFLEFMRPGLVEAIDCLARGGATDVTVVPMFLAQGGHVKKDLPGLLDEARALHPQCEVKLLAAVGEAPQVVVAMAAYAVQGAGAGS